MITEEKIIDLLETNPQQIYKYFVSFQEMLNVLEKTKDILITSEYYELIPKLEKFIKNHHEIFVPSSIKEAIEKIKEVTTKVFKKRSIPHIPNDPSLTDEQYMYEIATHICNSGTRELTLMLLVDCYHVLSDTWNLWDVKSSLMMEMKEKYDITTPILALEKILFIYSKQIKTEYTKYIEKHDDKY